MQTLEDLQKGLWVYYPLKGDAKDYSGYGYDGEPSPQVKYSPGKYGLAADFTTSHANIAIPAISRYANQYTLSAWVNLKDYKNIDEKASTWGTFVGRLAVNHKDGSLMFFFYYDSEKEPDNQLLIFNLKEKVKLDEWYHVIVTYDHSTRKIRSYINGRLDNEEDLSTKVKPTDRPHLPTAFSIGGFPWETYEYASTLNGLVGDVMFLNIPVDQAGVDILAGVIDLPSIDDKLKGNAEILNLDPITIGFGIAIFIGVVAIAYQAYLLSKIKEQESEKPPVTLSELVEKIKNKVGYPADPSKRVSRSDLGIDNTYLIHIDVGGEGYKPAELEHGIESGFQNAINLNDVDHTTTTPPYRPIPNLVKLNDWKTNPPYPFADGFADYVTIQGSPLTDNNTEEIARILRCGGEVGLWISEDWDINRKNLPVLAAKLKSSIERNSYDEFQGRSGYSKIRIVKNC